MTPLASPSHTSLLSNTHSRVGIYCPLSPEQSPCSSPTSFRILCSNVFLGWRLPRPASEKHHFPGCPSILQSSHHRSGHQAACLSVHHLSGCPEGETPDSGTFVHCVLLTQIRANEQMAIKSPAQGLVLTSTAIPSAFIQHLMCP